MADIRKVLLMDGSKYEIGDKLFREGLSFTLKSLYLMNSQIDDEGVFVPIVRIYAEESGSPYLDIPYHNIGWIFYS